MPGSAPRSTAWVEGGVRLLLVGLAEVGGGLQGVLLLPALGGEADQVGLARPRPTGTGGVQTVATDHVGSRIREVLHEVDENPDRGEQLLVCLEVRIVF